MTGTIQWAGLVSCLKGRQQDKKNCTREQKMIYFQLKMNLFLLIQFLEIHQTSQLSLTFCWPTSKKGGAKHLAAGVVWLLTWQTYHCPIWYHIQRWFPNICAQQHKTWTRHIQALTPPGIHPPTSPCRLSPCMCCSTSCPICIHSLLIRPSTGFLSSVWRGSS